nr:GNAT family N-acetyltransferase [Bacillus sp. Cs-700]
MLNEEQVIGMVWLEHKLNDKGFIRDIRILDRYQGQGYGQSTMQAIEIVGKELGVEKIGLHVFGHNKVARGLYEKLGYQTTNVMMIKEI